MKLFKNVALCALLYTIPLVASEQVVPQLDQTSLNFSTSVEQPKLETLELIKAPIISVPAIEKPAEETAPVVVIAEKEKTEKEKWNDYLESLLVKGAFWDAAANTITTSWQDDAFSLAQDVLKKEPSMADELKNTFLSTVEKKFTNIESASNLKSFFEIIDSFNKKIDALSTELAGIKKEDKDNKSIAEVEKSSTEEPKKEDIISEPEQTTTPAEETAEEEKVEDTEKKKNKQDAEWERCLENIKLEGTEKREADNIIEETIAAAQSILSSLPSDEQGDMATELKKDFKDALVKRKENSSLFVINTIQAIQQFNKAIKSTLSTAPEQPTIPEPVLSEPQEKQAVPPTPKAPKEEAKRPDTLPTTARFTPPPMATTEKTEKPVVHVSPPQQTKDTTMFLNMQAQIAAKAHAEAALTREIQDALARKIKLAALEKAAAEKAESEKGIVSRAVEAVLGEWWAPKTTHKATLEKLQKEQQAIVEEQIKSKFDPRLTQDITTAYTIFQKVLLAFNDKPYWDQEKSIPNSKWVKHLERPIKDYLLRYNILTVDSILDIIKATLHTKKGINVEEHEKLMTGYEKLMTTISADLQEFIKNLEIEKVEVERQKKLAEKKRKEEELHQKIKEKEEKALEQQRLREQEKAKIERSKALPSEWKKLVQSITDRALDQDSLEQITAQAIQITQEMVALQPLQKQAIIEKHKTDFSQALVQQHRINEKKYVYDCMETFLQGIKE